MKVIDKIVEGFVGCKLIGKEIEDVEITYEKGKEPQVNFKCK